jgi:hypothetical protein
MSYCAGDLVEITEGAWKRYLEAEGLRKDRPPPGIRTVTRVTEQGVLLDYPLNFWNPSDLKFAPNWKRMVQKEYAR